MSQLRELAQPFDRALIKRAPQGKHGDYVPHPTINERLLEVLGPFTFELVEIVRGFAAEIKTKNNTFAARENAVVGVVARLTVEIDGRTVSIEEVGAEDNPAMKGDGDNLKTSMSDALKRCAMRLGLGLHLWSDAYYLDQALDAQGHEAKPSKPASEPLALQAQNGKPEGITRAQIDQFAEIAKQTGIDSDAMKMVAESCFDRELPNGIKSLTHDEAAELVTWDLDKWTVAADAYRVPS